MKLLLSSLLLLQVFSSSKQIAEVCEPNKCLISENCRCSSINSPLPLADTPQLISLTFDEAVVDNLFTEVWQPILFHRKNPDGNPISATFFVPHEYTDYSRVQELYLRGYEIGVNSITKNSLSEYWEHASEETLIEEFGGQRTLLSHFANIPIEDVSGAQAPQVQIEGDILIRAYVASGVKYDNSWTSRSTNLLFPYTLDYLSTQECRTDTSCPKESYPGFWINPLNNIRGDNLVECNALTNCDVRGTANEIALWLLEEVDRIRSSSKAPLTLLVPSAWFRFIENSFEGFQLFLDSLARYPDTFLVNQKQIIEWVKNPVPVSEFRTTTEQRTASCSKINCPLLKNNTDIRYMMSCVPCPDVYPWLGNPLGKF